MDAHERALKLLKLCRHHFKLSTKMMREQGITQGQPPILEYLSKNDGCIQSELSRNCRLEPATITSILTTMERDGLIERRASPEDRRVWRIFLTETGRTSHNLMRKTSALVGDICFSGFSPDESAQTIEFLRRMNENIQHALSAEDTDTMKKE